jgi:radical SAM protein (TIGR01212 family)
VLYYNLSSYLREKYGKRMKKICIDGGFTCPNRDGKCGTGGCIFCGERGSGEHIAPLESVRAQVENQLSGARCDDLFIAYFQNFTNTYAPPERLREIYDSALIDERIKILAIGTRPDCIDERIADLILQYKEKYEVWIELGLQTANDNTARLINRGYTRDIFERAMRILSERNIKTVVHLMLGLPTENMEDAIESANYLSKFDIFGVKIHSLYVMEGTQLAKIYRENRYTPPSLSEYADMASEVLARLPKSTVIHRITGDCPRDMLVAPDWNRDKTAIINAVNDSMKKKEYSQGSLR